MFSKSKANQFLPPSHEASISSNKKYNRNLNNSATEFCNRSFDTAQSLFHKTGGNLRQTKICFRKRKYSEEINDENFSKEIGPSAASLKTEFFLMPIPKNAEIQRPEVVSRKQILQDRVPADEQTTLNDIDASSPSNPMEKNGRDKLVLVGMVDFCLKMHKFYPNVNALWEVYGKLIKIVPGDSKNESILILRSLTGTGPVLQSIYFDVDNILEKFQLGCHLRAVGNFISANRLKTFKLEPINSEKYEEQFSRIQNVISYVLL